MRFFTACLFLTSCLCAQEIDLLPYEHSICSQNGEDGVLEKLFSLIPPEEHYFVDIGAYDGITGSNTYLLSTKGWKGLLLDNHHSNLALNLHEAFITAENVNEILSSHNVPPTFDLLSIDIDYNDFHVWQALAPHFRPAIVVIEHNASHLPHEDKVVPYHPYYTNDGTNYFGASLLALYRLGRSKGYSLIYTESHGVNLFFARDDLLTQLSFKEVNEPTLLYRRPTYGAGPNGGHPADPQERPYVSAETLLR